MRSPESAHVQGGTKRSRCDITLMPKLTRLKTALVSASILRREPSVIHPSEAVGVIQRWWRLCHHPSNGVDAITQMTWKEDAASRADGGRFHIVSSNGVVWRYRAAELLRYFHSNATKIEPISRYHLNRVELLRLQRAAPQALAAQLGDILARDLDSTDRIERIQRDSVYVAIIDRMHQSCMSMELCFRAMTNITSEMQTWDDISSETRDGMDFARQCFVDAMNRACIDTMLVVREFYTSSVEACGFHVSTMLKDTCTTQCFCMCHHIRQFIDTCGPSTCAARPPSFS